MNIDPEIAVEEFLVDLVVTARSLNRKVAKRVKQTNMGLAPELTDQTIQMAFHNVRVWAHKNCHTLLVRGWRFDWMLHFKGPVMFKGETFNFDHAIPMPENVSLWREKIDSVVDEMVRLVLDPKSTKPLPRA